MHRVEVNERFLGPRSRSYHRLNYCGGFTRGVAGAGAGEEEGEEEGEGEGIPDYAAENGLREDWSGREKSGWGVM